MSRRPGGGAISKNTLSLRFMQNAARVLQEQEVEATKAKIRTEEEWELPKALWGGIEDSQEEPIVTYEQSYLPFLFPGFGSSRGQSSAETEGVVREDGLTGRYKGRRKVAMEIAEEMEQDGDDEKPPPDTSSAADKIIKSLPRGTRALSSRGRSSPSKPPKSVQAVPRPAASQGFMKPQVDPPKPLKRQADDNGEGRRRKKPKEQDT